MCTRRLFLSKKLSDRIYYVMYLPRDSDVENKLTGDDLNYLDNIAYDSQVEDIISDSIVSLIRSRENIILNWDYLFRRFSELNSVLVKAFVLYDRAIKLAIKNNRNPPTLEEVTKDLFNEQNDRVKAWFYRQLDQLSKICSNQTDEFKWLLTASNQLDQVYPLDVKGFGDWKTWTSVLLFNNDKQYVGSVNIYEDRKFNRIQMTGIKGSLYKIMGRKCDKGESDIASKILEAVKLYAIGNINQIFVLGPIGMMPGILQRHGFKVVDKSKQVSFMLKDYYTSIYNPDGSLKVFSNINIEEIR